MKKLILLLGLSWALASTQATLITEPTRVFNINQNIADLQDPAIAYLQTINDSSILFLTDVQVGLHLVGVTEGAGFASEMFVSLNKNLTDTSILLNQVGVSASDPVGAYYDGWQVTFSDGAIADVHTAWQDSGILTGSWQADGRIDPTTLARAYPLSIFNGGAGNGDWRLAVADLELGGQMRLESWSLTFTGETGSVGVSDNGSSLSLLLAAVLIAMAFHERRTVWRT